MSDMYMYIRINIRPHSATFLHIPPPLDWPGNATVNGDWHPNRDGKWHIYTYYVYLYCMYVYIYIHIYISIHI